MLQFLLVFCYFFLVSCKFDPYVDNGGTILGLAGKGYVIIASDTRLSDQYMIRSRRNSRLFELDNGIIFTGSGCWSDTFHSTPLIPAVLRALFKTFLPLLYILYSCWNRFRRFVLLYKLNFMICV